MLLEYGSGGALIPDKVAAEGGEVQENNRGRTKGAGSTRPQGKIEPEENRKAGGDVNVD